MTTDLTERVRATLRDRADRLEVAVPPFDPTAPPALDLPVPPARRPRGLLVAAAVLVVALVAGGVALARGGGGEDGSTAPATEPPATEAPTTGPGTTALTQGPTAPSSTAPVAGSTGAAAMVPTTVPDGLELTSISMRDHGAGQLLATQLFAEGDAQVLITVQPAHGDSPGSGPTVRGAPATSRASKEHPDQSSALTWAEEGYSYTADHTGLSVDDAVAFLDGLARRPAGGPPLFDAPPDSLELVGEAAGGSFPVRTTEAGYEGDGRTLDVRVVEPLGEATTYDAVQARYLGQVDAEGRTTSYDPRYDEVEAVWPDGRRVLVLGDGSFGEEALRQVALGVAPVDETGLLMLRSRTADAVLDSSHVLGPLVSLGDAGGPGVDLLVGIRAAVDDPDAPRTCVVVPGHRPACEGAEPGSGVASAIIDGRWFVGLATTDPDVRLTLAPGSPGADPAPIPGVNGGEVDGWVFWVAVVPDDVDEVFVGTDLRSANLLRPAG